MSGFLQDHTPEWIDYFTLSGYPGARPLSSGVEGAIYTLGDGVVAKVWGKRQEAELRHIQGFYQDVTRVQLPFTIPEILRIENVGGVAVTYERELHGEPLRKHLAFDGADVDLAGAEAVSEVLACLATVPVTARIKEVSVLDEQCSMWAGKSSFAEALIGLLERRMIRFAPVLAGRVEAFDRKYRCTVDGIVSLGEPQLSALHGDLFGENILVDDTMKVTAVLDFGFLSTGGDPRLDAAISAAIFDMYGPHARRISGSLTRRFAEELHYPIDTLRLYQAAYALATSNFFTPDGAEGDGHFE